jgi:hypothetical protein
MIILLGKFIYLNISRFRDKSLGEKISLFTLCFLYAYFVIIMKGFKPVSSTDRIPSPGMTEARI